MKIYCPYKIIDDPWGGANNFLRALQHELAAHHGVIFVDDPDTRFDLLFMNELGQGPGQGSCLLSFLEFQILRAKNPKAPVVVRAVNLRRHSFPKIWPYYWGSGDRQKDHDTLNLLKAADHVIFQSAYQQGFFAAAGYKGQNFSIIHNGADERFVAVPDVRPTLSFEGVLRVFSSSFSPRATKRHDLIAKFSAVPGVEVFHAGRWPNDLDPDRVSLLNVLTHDAMLAQLAQAHFFLHPAIKDPCPNSMIEALSAGVPVLYNPGSGSGAELAGPYGVAIDAKDIGGTVRRARGGYERMVKDLSNNRQIFSISRAACDYVRVFKKALVVSHS